MKSVMAMKQRMLRKADMCILEEKLTTALRYENAEGGTADNGKKLTSRLNRRTASIKRKIAIGMNRIGAAVVLFLFSAILLKAQLVTTSRSSIRSVQILLNDEWNCTPVLALNGSDHLTVSFDDLAEEYRRYRYRIVHCDFDWQPTTTLFDSDYLRGETSSQPIDDWEESLNTTQLFVHYSFTFPNGRVRPAVSGNYKLVVFDDNADEDVCEIRFYVVETLCTIRASVTTQTDIDRNQSHQQLKFSVRPQSGARIVDADREIKTRILQNDRWDNAVRNPKIDYKTGTELQWEYARELIFDAGNEYRRFEVTNLHVGRLGVDNIRWFYPYYHFTLYEDKPRLNYTYIEDQNGGFLPRTEEYEDDDIESDYVLVHFTLKREPLLGYDVYVSSPWWPLDERCRMEYDSDGECYRAALFLKQGYYNYMYLTRAKGGTGAAATEPIEGNYYQTENKYTIFVYHRPQGGRYDKLIGVSNINFAVSR